MTRGALEAVSPFVDRSSLGNGEEIAGRRRRVVTRPCGVSKLVLARVSGSEFPDRIGLRLLLSPAIGPTRRVPDQRRL